MADRAVWASVIRTICAVFAALALAVCVAGCGGEKASAGYTAANEILTYKRIDPNKTQIVVSRTGNVALKELCLEFEARNPDVQVVNIDITGGNTGYKPLTDWITKGYAPDVVVTAADFFDDALISEYFESLSLNPVIQRYEAEALNRVAVEHDVYWLPGPSDISAMMYNKTLFERYGWEVPVSFDDFVRLCDRIREDTNGSVEAWNPNAKYNQEFQTAIEAFAYEELFGGIGNRTWYNSFIAGKATFAGHMEPMTRLLETLIDHGILREEHFSYSATARLKEFMAGKIAMINLNLFDADNADFEFGFMPFPTTKGRMGYIFDSYNCCVGVCAKERSDKQRDAVNRFIEFFSSDEGQRIYIGKSMMVSNVKGVRPGWSDSMSALRPAIDIGHTFSPLDFQNSEASGRDINLRQIAFDMTAGKATGDECIAAIDDMTYTPEGGESAQGGGVVGTAAKDMTILETSFYIADAYREAVGADIGLVADNESYRGNLMRIFAGEITRGFIEVLKPRSFANGSALVKVSMTGKQLMSALNDPVGYEKPSECVYAYSGLKCEIAPWNEPGEKCLKIETDCGDALAADGLYTVAFWEGTVNEAYITEILERSELVWEEIISAKIASDKIVNPANDARIKLVWD